MIRLNIQQTNAVEQPGNVLVTACPGSGKTRLLTYRVAKGLEELTSPKQRVVALTFTNRAADEIRSRLDGLSISCNQLWVGTIHAFALEWILRPYAPYVPRLQRGFSVADEFLSQKILNELKVAAGEPPYFEVNTTRDRDGRLANGNDSAIAIFQAYQQQLQERKLLDYDDIMHYAYTLLIEREEVPRTLAAIIRLFCVDEIQDTQDLQYGILSAIFRAASDSPTLFFVGDPDQSIYESLGAVSRSADEIAAEFGLEALSTHRLTGNYRSTQRIIDFYQHFRPGDGRIRSRASYSAEQGTVVFHNQTVSREDLSRTIGSLILSSLESGVPASEICVLAPQWWHIRKLGRSLVSLLPDVDFDAPGLSPLHCQRDNFWFKATRLFLTEPIPNLYRTRMRWAGQVIKDLDEVSGVSLPETLREPRMLLRLVNSISSSMVDGLDFLREVFEALTLELQVSVDSIDALSDSYEVFFEKARAHIEEIGDDAPTTVHHFRKLFKHPSGVVISTCHGVKGEEYDTVIVFGLLKGYVPHWKVIIHGTAETAADWESKLLYVICSRAKKHLHLIAESGRFTQTNNPYRTSALLESVDFDYDQT